MRRLAIVAFVAMLLLPGYVEAQGMEGNTQDQDGSAQEVDAYETDYMLEDADWREHRFHVALYGGNIAGGTNVGFTDNLFFQVSFEQGSDSAFGGRVGWAFAPRFEVELEFGTASPGLDAVLRDLSGQGRTVAPFAELDLTWVSGSVNYSVIERSRRFVPYLSLGLGVLSVGSSTEPSIDTTEPLIAFGAGLRVRITDPLSLRFDARGLRSGLGGKQTDSTRPAVLLGQFNGTNLLWTLGAQYSF